MTRRMLASKTVLLTLPLLILPLASCEPARNATVVISGEPAPDGAPVGVDIQSAGGNVWVEVIPSLPEPRIDLFGPPNSEGAKPASWVGAERVVEDGHSVLRVLNTPTDGNSTPVFIRVQTPRCDGVRIRTVGGEVRVLGATGVIDVDSAAPTDSTSDSSSVEIVTREPLTGAITARAAGPVTVHLSRHSDATVTLDSRGLCEFRSPHVAFRGVEITPRGRRAVLNEGTHAVSIESDSGPACVEVGHQGV